ncbi:MAG: hypothetical protein HZC17_07020 [Candidatus Omnitrophica bacterium]|nr:hypothetical protein [Candidatus Omnitrophota bacterium]
MKNWIAAVLVIALFFPSIAFSETPESPREKILIVKERAVRDREKAIELKSKAETQITNARAIMDRAAANPDDPSLKNKEQVLALAPGALKYGEEVLVKAEKNIQDADLKIIGADRALKYLNDATVEKQGMKKQFYSGGAFPLLVTWQGQVGVSAAGNWKNVPLTENGILPGDMLNTGKDSQLELLSFYCPDNVLTVGAETQLVLSKDNPEETRWGLMSGKIHSRPTSDDSKIPPRIVTPKGVIEAAPGSEFDVIVAEDGQTTVTPYKGDVKLTAFKDQSPFWDDVVSGDKKKTEKPWWELSGK